MKTKLLAGFGLGLAAAFVCAPANNLFADQVRIFGRGGFPPSWSQTATNGTGSVTVANSGLYWSVKATTSMGCMNLDLTVIGPPYPYASSTSASGFWGDTITFQPDNPALLGTPGTAVFTYHLSGSQSLSQSSQSQNYYSIFTECGCGVRMGIDYGDGTYSGPRISDLATFTETRGFTFGAPMYYEMHLSGVVSRYSSGGFGTLHVTLATGGITVLDGAGNSVAYSSTANAGVGRAWIFPDGASYVGFSVTNNLNNHTVLSLLGGTNSLGTNETVAVTFLSSPDTNQIISDVADLSSSALTNLNKLVIQMSYDPAQAIARLGSETNALLIWFNQPSNKWVNAVEGNSDGGLARQFFLGAFNLATQFQSGNHGVDTNNHVAWAVVDHHSQFAVGAVTPALRFAGLSVGTNGTSLMLSGPPTGQFIIDYSSSLVAADWNLLGLTTLGTNGTGIFNDATSSSANARRFYRARQ